MEILKKLSTIQVELKVPKTQRNEFGEFNYRSCEDIFEAVRPLLKKYGLVLVVGDELIAIGNRYYVKATATLTDIDDGGSICNTAYARENESRPKMDVAQVTGTASSYARKYALSGLFILDDNKDIDSCDNRQAAAKSVHQQAQQPKTSAPKPAAQQVAKQSTPHNTTLKEPNVTSYHNGNMVRYIDGRQCQVKSNSGIWCDIEQLSNDQLEQIIKAPNLSAAHAPAKATLDARSVKR